MLAPRGSLRAAGRRERTTGLVLGDPPAATLRDVRSRAAWAARTAAVALGAVLVVGCASGTRFVPATPTPGPAVVSPRSPGPPGASLPAPSGIVRAEEELQVLLVSGQLWPGENHLLLDLLDRDGRRLAQARPDVAIRVGRPGEEPTIDVPVDVVQLAPDARPLFRGVVDLDVPGPWSVSATVGEGQDALSGSSWFEVGEDGGTIALGEPVPASDTPTGATAEALRAISSNPEPDPDFYAVSVRDALEAGEPFVFVIDSFTFRTNEACGGGLGHLIHLHDEFPGLAMIHAEPYRVSLQGGELALESPGGPPRLAEWSEAWGIAEPPWTFVVDGEGRLRGKFQGIVSSDELRSLMHTVAGTPLAAD